MKFFFQKAFNPIQWPLVVSGGAASSTQVPDVPFCARSWTPVWHLKKGDRYDPSKDSLADWCGCRRPYGHASDLCNYKKQCGSRAEHQCRRHSECLCGLPKVGSTFPRAHSLPWSPCMATMLCCMSLTNTCAHWCHRRTRHIRWRISARCKKILRRMMRCCRCGGAPSALAAR